MLRVRKLKFKLKYLFLVRVPLYTVWLPLIFLEEKLFGTVKVRERCIEWWFNSVERIAKSCFGEREI